MPKDAKDVHQQPKTTIQARRPPSGKSSMAGGAGCSDFCATGSCPKYSIIFSSSAPNGLGGDVMVSGGGEEVADMVTMLVGWA